MANAASTFKAQKPLVSKLPWEQILDDSTLLSVLFGDVLEAYIMEQRWYGGKSSQLKYIELAEFFKLQQGSELYYGLILEVNFVEAFYQHYFLPIAFVTKTDIAEQERILAININEDLGYIVDATHLESFRKMIFERILTAETVDRTSVQYHKSASLKNIKYESSRFLTQEQSNTSIIYNENYVLKFFRRIFADKNPDYEMSRFLSEKKGFINTPKYLGSINVVNVENELLTIALMQELVQNTGNAWCYMCGELERIFQIFKQKHIDLDKIPKTERYTRLSLKDIPYGLVDWVGLDFLLSIQNLAKRTAEMHIALASGFEETAFTPTHYNGDYEVWLKNRLLYQFQNRLNIIENNLNKLNGLALQLAQELRDNKNSIRKRFTNFDWTKLKGQRTRIHGDYHLGQILMCNNDFYILDFEGEPESTIRDRKVKQPPLKDVAGLFRSFHYAIYSVIFGFSKKDNGSLEQLFTAGELLYDYIMGLFLETYVSIVRDANLNIGYHQERIFLLKYALLEKAVYELGYELNSRPNWAIIPLKGISNIINN